MSSPTTARRSVVAALAAICTAGLVATAGPAAAVPYEGEPTPGTCLRVVHLPGAGSPGSTLFVSHGYALVLDTGAACSGAIG